MWVSVVHLYPFKNKPGQRDRVNTSFECDNSPGEQNSFKKHMILYSKTFNRKHIISLQRKYYSTYSMDIKKIHDCYDIRQLYI